MNLLTRPELASDTPAHEDHHAHDHSHEQGGMKVFGMWVYLMSDLVLFGSLFASYAVLSTAYAGGPTGKDLFSLPPCWQCTAMTLRQCCAGWAGPSCAAPRSSAWSSTSSRT
ncbi:hypothetical protein G6F57_018770 [Rhizopus arrhizus]|nr:hypothetical protein G6F57_018770 [Rhizopus arrhizus]